MLSMGTAHIGAHPDSVRLQGEDYDMALSAETKALELEQMRGWIKATPHPPGQDLADGLAAAAYRPPNGTTKGIVILNSDTHTSRYACLPPSQPQLVCPAGHPVPAA